MREGEVLEGEEDTLLERLYFRNELQAMVGVAGFQDMQVLADDTDSPAPADGEILIYGARKLSTGSRPGSRGASPA
ncbi:MAG TPA: hypothetical protein VIH26_07985 [Anaerolineales bacterium]